MKRFLLLGVVAGLSSVGCAAETNEEASGSTSAAASIAADALKVLADSHALNVTPMDQKACDTTGAYCLEQIDLNGFSTILSFIVQRGSHDVLSATTDGGQLTFRVQKQTDIDGSYTPFSKTFTVTRAAIFKNVTVTHVSNHKPYSAEVTCIVFGGSDGKSHYAQGISYLVNGQYHIESDPDKGGPICETLFNPPPHLGH